MSKTIAFLTAIVIIVGAAFFLINSQRESPSAIPDSSQVAPPAVPPPSPLNKDEGPSPEPQPTPQPSPIPPPSPAKTVEVIYTDSGYQPASITVKTGTTVNFKNQSSNPMWTASDPHPVHTNLSGFDNLKGLGRGESYSFTFSKSGIWGYHNHLLPGHKGSVVVE